MALIIVNTLVAGASGMIAVIPVRVLLTNGIVEVDYIINGVLAGLVSITALCHAVTPQQAFIIGIIGAWVMLMFDVLLLMFRIDDAVGAVPVHLGGGIWGTMAVAIFGNPVIEARSHASRDFRRGKHSACRRCGVNEVRSVR